VGTSAFIVAELLCYLAGTLQRKPSRDEGIVSTKPRPKSVYSFLGLLYCFVVYSVCLVHQPYIQMLSTPVVRYSLFVLKVPLDTSQPNQTCSVTLMLLAAWLMMNDANRSGAYL